ncbi:MarR family winged helix-turn-helix transcriptional regulator [Sphingopyxis sp.]|uniref:MarR family winged helix-turn-helix transcriptional regulator n=1 Tax=Sphingopyxis sp. TaxID=1908224 RepID=UPI003D6C8376
MKTSLGFLLDDTARLFRRSFDAKTRGDGVTALQYRLLKYLAEHPGTRQSALAQRLELAPITLSRMITRLVATGLVLRLPDSDDRRAKCLHVTGRAPELLDEVAERAEATVREAIEGLSQGENEDLARLIGRVRTNLSRVAEAHSP